MSKLIEKANNQIREISNEKGLDIKVCKDSSNFTAAESRLTSYGGEIKLSDSFFQFPEINQRFMLAHEIGHLVFDYIDYFENNMKELRNSSNNSENLLRVKWMKENGWKIDENFLKKLAKANPLNDCFKDPSKYIIHNSKGCLNKNEWNCLSENRISNFNKYGFNYSSESYSPIEEMADVYAALKTFPKRFSILSLKNPILRKKGKRIKSFIS